MTIPVADIKTQTSLPQFPAAPPPSPSPSPGATPKTAYAALPDLPAASVDAVYLHVPFCSTKCHYCDFYSLAGHLDQADAYLDALAVELQLQSRHFGRANLPRPETIFIGGGTPTLLDAPRLQRLLQLLHSALDCSRLIEFTVEANPNTFDAARADVLAAAGVNRLSFGAQSFIPSELATLQRDHDPASVPAAFATARAAGIANLNTDLIFGIPGQTLDTWEYSLAQALARGSSHLSCYSLTYEPNTPMTARMKRGEFAPLGEELELRMFNHVYQRLRAAGFQRYEVSNYARPGMECRHNIHYWKGGNWLAFGPSAAAHMHGHRWKNVTNLTHYLDALTPGSPSAGSGGGGNVVRASCPQSGGRPARAPSNTLGGGGDNVVRASCPQSGGRPARAPSNTLGGGGGEGVVPATQMERLDPARRAGELAIFWLRLAEGLNYAEFQAHTGFAARHPLERALARFAAMGLVELTEHRARLLEKAVPVSDRILRDVVDAWESVV